MLVRSCSCSWCPSRCWSRRGSRPAGVPPSRLGLPLHADTERRELGQRRGDGRVDQSAAVQALAGREGAVGRFVVLPGLRRPAEHDRARSGEPAWHLQPDRAISGPPPPVTHVPPVSVSISGPDEGSLISTTVPTALGDAGTRLTVMSSRPPNAASSELWAGRDRRRWRRCRRCRGRAWDSGRRRANVDHWLLGFVPERSVLRCSAARSVTAASVAATR